MLGSLGAGHARVITFQLGSGASVTASREGRAVDTSMGFTPLEGLMMGTRSGDLDPALVAYLQAGEGCSAAEVERLLFQLPMAVTLDQVHLSTHEIDCQQIALELLVAIATEYHCTLHSRLAGCSGRQARVIALATSTRDQGITAVCQCLRYFVFQLTRFVSTKGQISQIIPLDRYVQSEPVAQMLQRV